MISTVNIFRQFSRKIDQAQDSRRFHVFLVYFSILLDNLLLTVVVPVIPDFLVGLHVEQQQQNSSNENHSNRTFNHFVIDHHFGINGRSMAILNHYDPKTFNQENGQIGTILSSKAFVQLVFNPF
ncbi:portabella-like protein, partial [Euroglyphus maynei]